MKSLLTLCVLICCSFSFAQSGEMSARFINYPDGQNVPRFQKLEVGVKLPAALQLKVDNYLKERPVNESEKINPFLEWELDVEAVFTHEVSGTVKKVDGFFYREYQRNIMRNLWKEVGTEEPMRIRFSPPVAGNWTCTVTMSVKGQPLEGAETLAFTVTDSDSKGYISVHENERNLQLNGELIYPVGANFPAPMRGVNNYHGQSYKANETHKVSELKNWIVYRNDIEHYNSLGGKYIRTLQNGWGSLLEFEKKGNYYDRQPYAWEQDRLLEYCEQNGIYVLFDLMQQEPFMKYGNYFLSDWDWSHYNKDQSYDEEDTFPAYCYADGKNKEPYEAFMYEEDMRYHEQRTRYYIARYGYSTSISMFELLSEPWHLNQFWEEQEPFLADTPLGDSVRKAVLTYHTRMAAYIKKDLGHTEHLVSVDLLPDFYMDEKYIDQSIYSPDIDVICINAYAQVPDKLIIAKAGDNNMVLPNENSMYRNVTIAQQKVRKPVFISEGGMGGNDDCSAYVQQNIDMATFGFTGVAGYNSWVGSFDNQQQYLAPIALAQKFMNDAVTRAVLEAQNGSWVQGRQAEKRFGKDKKKAKELQYYLAGDGSGACGYVRNRTSNFHSARTSEGCFNASIAESPPLDTLTNITWNEGTKELYVEGLKRRQTYKITWFDPKTGEKLTEQVQRSGRKLVLKFPELKVTEPANALPVVWFTVTVSDQ